MKLLTKRIIAALIDTFILGSIMVLFQKTFEFFGVNASGFSKIMVVVLFSFKDLPFRNASVGKKILGIAVYDKDFEKPTVKKTVFRSLATAVVGHVFLFKIIFVSGDIISFFDWEKTLGCFVADKKVIKRLKLEAENGKEDINEMYNAYLRSIYPS